MLPVVRTVAALRATVAEWRRERRTVALVPTMGALHEGHLSLVRLGLDQADRAVATIFVNPKQFGANEDLARYPRQEAADVEKLTAAGAHLLFAPSPEEMYPLGFATTVSVTGLTDCLCGPLRPGHFDGVATVVSKLLLQAMPEIALFGEKDYQQLMVIRRFVRDLDMRVRIIGGPTVREADGLAMSSRNLLLSPADRAIAPALHRAMAEIAARVAAGKPAAAALAQGQAAILAAGFRAIDYLELRDAETLAVVETAARPARVFAAAWLGQVRLIDNLSVA